MTQAVVPPTQTTAGSLQIALVGNPNTGKSALFNRLTGARQRVGNYPGLTVEKKLGQMRLGHGHATVIDLPGMYSLAAISLDESIVLEVLNGRDQELHKPDLVVCVVDATNLARNLFFATQVAQTGLPMVVALNMWDEAQEQGLHIDCQKLSQRLGVPVVPTVAAKGKGVRELIGAIEEAVQTRPRMIQVPWPQPVLEAADIVRQAVIVDTGRSISDAELYRLLFDIDSPIGDRLGWILPQREPALAQARERIKAAGLSPVQIESITRYGYLNDILEDVLVHPAATKTSVSDRIDRVITHRALGLLVFLAVMYTVFLAIYKLAQPLMDGIDGLFAALGNLTGGYLQGMPMLQSLLVDGIIAGVGGVIIFLPQIVILFFFIALLEDSGYMARAAFLMDKLFSWCGLNGKSFVPMLSSYACGVPGIMATRTIEDPKSRLTTILIAPLMSCSARLPVYVLLIGAFIEPRFGALWAGLALLAMHMLGLVVAIPVAFVLNRFILRGQSVPFVLEMPPYRLPHLRDVFWRMYERGREFTLRAGTVIFAVSIVIWALCYFPRSPQVAQNVEQAFTAQVAQEQQVDLGQAASLIESDEGLQARLESAINGAYLEQSVMGRTGKFVQPVFAPAGFDWKITVGVLASFPAREVIISTLGIIYDLGGDVDDGSETLRSSMQKSRWDNGALVFSPVVAFSVMVFFALCMQCAATLAVIVRESSWRWAVFAFVYMTGLAWVAAVIVFQVGTHFFPV